MPPGSLVEVRSQEVSLKEKLARFGEFFFALYLYWEMPLWSLGN